MRYDATHRAHAGNLLSASTIFAYHTACYTTFLDKIRAAILSINTYTVHNEGLQISLHGWC